MLEPIPSSSYLNIRVFMTILDKNLRLQMFASLRNYNIQNFMLQDGHIVSYIEKNFETMIVTRPIECKMIVLSVGVEKSRHENNTIINNEDNCNIIKRR